MSIILVTRRQRQEDYKFEAMLGYIATTYLKQRPKLKPQQNRETKTKPNKQTRKEKNQK